ncbi:YitT family protein [Butyrivibrio sp. MC2013]|uniref:YitT family protein n=1 Tax=Butyrivibrio sp. MC2013 TaxID=1280686 RepID=UPI0003F6F39B|nr:YitT family protein [Butyrivibrio sp. MC2013]
MSTADQSPRKSIFSETMPFEYRSSDIPRILLCIASGILISINLRTFVYAGDLMPGGFAGLTLLIQQIASSFFGIIIPYSVLYIGFNAIPVVISFLKIGKKYTIYSCITIILISFLTDVIPEHPITYDILLISIFGGLVNGFAVALSLRADATTGGTDFIAIWISEKYRVDAFNYILIFNASLLCIDGLVFGWDKALYSIIFQYTSTQIIHLLYKRYQKKTLLIITEKPGEITNTIYKMTGHGATDINAYGSYENAKRTIVYSVVSSGDLKPLMTEISSIDPSAFVNVMRTEQLTGKFHMPPTD